MVLIEPRTVEKTVENYPQKEVKIPEDMKAKHIVHAALFMAGKLTLEEMAETAKITVNEARDIGKELMSEISEPLELIRPDELSFELRIKEEYLPIISHVCERADFTEAELKTLALIAYYQPLKRVDLVKHRGVMGHVHANKFIEDGYVTEEDGKLSTTERFERYFGIKELTREDLQTMTEA